LHKIAWFSFFQFKSRGTKLPFSSSKNSLPPSRTIEPHFVQLSDNLKTLVSNRNHTLNPSGKFNLSLNERKSIVFLKNDKSIVIHPADKGGKIVIQSRENYIFEALRQLNDTRFYKLIPLPIYLKTSIIIKRMVNILLYQGFICKSQYLFLLPPVKPRQRHFYLLPKIHKDPDTWTIPYFIPPGRPIVSGCNSESAAVESFIDHFLQPIASSSFSYLRDSSHLKAIFHNLVIKNSDILVTFDVESLYTNIPISEGIDSIRKAFLCHPVVNRPDKHILKLLEVTLFRNDFSFLNQTFLQIKGTAMGKKYAPSFANIFMNEWEQHALLLAPMKPSLWKRYIDDIFCIWPFSLFDLQAFIQHLNSINLNIKLTATHSLTHVNYLDCTFFKSANNTICSKVFCKDTDSHNLLHPLSYHPSHTFSGIIIAQILRYIRLSTFHNDFLFSYRILKSSLKSLGYTRSVIRNCKFKAFNLIGLLKNQMISGCQPCNYKQCNVCKHINNISFIRGNKPNSEYLITQNTSCNTSNCIYSLNCTLCSHLSTLYVGETKNTFRDRFNQHLSDIRCKKDTPVSLHFNLPLHSISNVKTTIIQFFLQKSTNPLKTDSVRKFKESAWINKLHCLSPVGLNTISLHKSCFVPLTLPYCKTSIAFSNQVKSLIAKNEKLKETLVPLLHYSNNSNLKRLLAPTKLV